MSLRGAEKMTLEFLNSRGGDSYEAGQMICNAFNSTKLQIGRYFTAPFYDGVTLAKYSDGTLQAYITYRYEACRRTVMNANYTGGGEAGLESFVSQFYMPKMITF